MRKIDKFNERYNPDQESKLEDMSNQSLLEFFENAVRDDHYQPYGEKLNTSNYSLSELETEIEKRLDK